MYYSILFTLLSEMLALLLSPFSFQDRQIEEPSSDLLGYC